MLWLFSVPTVVMSVAFRKATLFTPTISPPVSVVEPVTTSVPPTVALLVTARPVPVDVKLDAPVKVLAPAPL